MKAIEINNKPVKYYESFEEAKASSQDKEKFERVAKECHTDFLNACEATGAAKIIWIEDKSCWSCIDDLRPILLVDGVAIGYGRYAGPSSNYYFFGLNYVNMLDGDNWKYDQPKPNNVGKPTAKALKAWAKYIKEKHAAAIEHRNELQQHRAATLEKNLKILKNAGFIPYYQYESFEEAREFECIRGAIRCKVFLDFNNEMHISYDIDYQSVSELFSDIK